VIRHEDERAITGTIVIAAAAARVPSSVGVFPTFYVVGHGPASYPKIVT
jgi:hypothetical protein